MNPRYWDLILEARDIEEEQEREKHVRVKKIGKRLGQLGDHNKCDRELLE
jgi:hypothetical protein